MTTPSPSTRRLSRAHVMRAFVFVAGIVFMAATVKRFHWLGGPYFEIPRTIQDHVWPARFPSADAILLSRHAEPLLARGAEVTLLTPGEAPNYDQTHWLTGLGLLPRQNVVKPDLDGSTRGDLTDYVLAIRDPFPHPAYRLVHQFPEGALYEVRP
jgi:hypothetical protein